jgi:hypothetical protein
VLTVGARFSMPFSKSVVVLAALALAACALAPRTANAAWSATAGFGETIEANDNPQVESNSSGGAVGSITDLSLQAGYDWPTANWTIGTNLGFTKYWGPGAQDSFDGVNVGALTTSFNKSTPLTSYNASFSGSFLPSAQTEIFDSGITNADTKTVSYSAEAGLTHQLNALNAFGLSVSGWSESFIESGSSNSEAQNALTPNTYLSAGQSWIRTLTPITSLTFGATTSWYNAEGPTGTNSVAESLTAQIQTQPSKNVSFSGLGGGYLVRTTGDCDSTSSGDSDSTSTGFIADLAVSYALPNASISAFALHNLEPSSLGCLQPFSSAGLSIGYPINAISSISFSGTFGYQWPTTNQQHQALVLNVGYQRSLTPNWSFGLAYSFTQQSNGDDEFFRSFNDQGSSASNAVFATISRSFDLLAGPPSTSELQNNGNWIGGGAWTGRQQASAADEFLPARWGMGGSRMTSVGNQY